MTHSGKLSQNAVRKGGCIIAGILLAVLFSLPYFIFRDELQNMQGLGCMGVLISCAISNVSVLLPTSSTLIVLSASSVLNPFLCVLMGGIGTAIGEQASYFCGRVGGAGFIDDKSSSRSRVLRWIDRNPFITVFLFALVPLPLFDIAGTAAGAKKIPWIQYTAAAVLGKTLKFLIAVVLVFRILPAAAELIPGDIGHLVAPLYGLIPSQG